MGDLNSTNKSLKTFANRFIVLLVALVIFKILMHTFMQLTQIENKFYQSALEILFLLFLLTPFLFVTYADKQSYNTPIGKFFLKLLRFIDIFDFRFDVFSYKKTKRILNQLEEDLKNTLREQQGMTFKFKKINGKFIHTLCDGELLYKMGLKPEDVVGKTLEEFLPSDHVAEKLTYYERVWNGEDNVTYEGETNGVIYLASLRMIKKNDKVEEVIASCVDISKLKKAEELLRKSETMSVIGELAAGIAHEIRNPLTTLRGFVQLQQENNPLKNLTYYNVMLSELDRINAIVSELLVLAKPQMLMFKEMDVTAILQSTIQLLEPEARMIGIQIKTEFTVPAPPPLKVEENQLKQVFINILKNAMEAMPNGGFITVQVVIEDTKVLIRFIDQGCGIPSERIPRLGEPFYTTKEKGTGLGLMISFKIIERHNGSISIQSEIDKGTIFDIHLPI